MPTNIIWKLCNTFCELLAKSHENFNKMTEINIKDIRTSEQILCIINHKGLNVGIYFGGTITLSFCNFCHYILFLQQKLLN